MMEQNKTKKIPYGVSDLLIELTQNAMNIFNGKDICQALLPVALLCMMLTACSEETSDNNTPPYFTKKHCHIDGRATWQWNEQHRQQSHWI